MSIVIELKRPSTTRNLPKIPGWEPEGTSNRHLRVHIAVFSAIAVLMYTVAVLAASDSLDDKLWLVWLIFVIAISKLLLANGLFFAMLRADKSAEAELAIQESRQPRRAPRRTTRLFADEDDARDRPARERLKLVIGRAKD